MAVNSQLQGQGYQHGTPEQGPEDQLPVLQSFPADDAQAQHGPGNRQYMTRRQLVTQVTRGSELPQEGLDPAVECPGEYSLANRSW